MNISYLSCSMYVLCIVCHPPICVRWPGWVRGWCRLRMVEGPRTDKLLLSRRGVRSLPESGHSGGNCQQQATTTCRHQHPPLRRGRHPATNTNTAVPGKTRYLSNIVFYLNMYCSSAFLVLLLCTAGFFQRRLYSHTDNWATKAILQ